MRFPLPASEVELELVRKVGWAPVRAKAAMLAAGASVLAIGMFNPAEAQAANVPGIFQYSEDNIAINLLDIGEDDPAAEFGALVTDSNPGGHALAEAFVTCAASASCSNPGNVIQWARGTDSASNDFALGGSLAIGADAMADGASATAAAIIEHGLWQVAAAEGTAANGAHITGSFDIAAHADALAATGSAVAFAAVGAGISQLATSISLDGIASNALDNSGDLAITANANAQASAADAAATALIVSGVYQQALGQDLASVDLENSGTIWIEAGASAVAPNGIAAATASVAGILQFADARTRQFASTFTSGGDLVGTTSHNAKGPASGTLSNSGSIAVLASASAHGDVDASATAAVLGVLQVISGSSAEATIDNDGAITIAANVESEAGGSPRGVVFVSGISQAATAFSYQTVETISTSGVLTYQLSSTPVGPAVAMFDNSGDITVAGEVNVVALGTGTTNEGLGVAFVDGFDQFANGNGAEAIVNNSGSFTVVADVTVHSGNVANAVAIATGIDQFATAYAAHTTIVFGSGTTTPTSFAAAGTAVGPASANFDNSGSLTVVASIDSHGDALAFAGATASAIGQYAAGTDASVAIHNSGTIAAVADLSSSGRSAFGGVAAIGFQQAAQGTAAADAILDNAGTLAVMAVGQGDGVTGAFINATVFGGAQNVFSDGTASALIANSGSIEIGASASAGAGDTDEFEIAIAFAAAHGFGQLAQGQLAEVVFDNSGTIEVLAEVDVVAGDLAIGSATASGVIQQLATGTASGTASASIDNSGTILIGAAADVAGGSSALAVAAVTNAIVQLVTAGNGAAAELTNSGSITMVANAEALAAGGEITDFASAQAYVFGIQAIASATGSTGYAHVDLANAGSIDVNAVAHATASGYARALATAAYGLVGYANAVGEGPAGVTLTNEGSLTLVGVAEATGGYTAVATGIAIAGMDAYAQGFGDATAELVNSGELALVADAHASAGTNALAVAIAIDGLQANARAGFGDALADISNSGEFSMFANATASALNAQAFAIVGGTFFTGAVFQSAAAFAGNASAIIDNSGSMSILAHALANGEVIASASAIGGPGINQFAFATSGDAFSGLSNTGSLEFVAHAEAHATNSAYADAVFYNAVAQFANANFGFGSLNLSNEGAISLAVVAEAYGDAVAGALAVASHEVGQSLLVLHGEAVAELSNSGTIDLDVAAIANGSFASATAMLGSAVVQSVAAIGDGGEATAILDNSGSLDVAVMASAQSPDGLAAAYAGLDAGIAQYAGAGSSSYSFGTTSGGMSSALQHVFPTGAARVAFDNSGSVEIVAAAMAEGGTSAFATASGLAIEQFARGLDAAVELTNDGEVAIELGAHAAADGNASAHGSLVGISQVAVALESTVQYVATEGGGQITNFSTSPVGTGQASFTNSGSFQIVGIAGAEAGTGSANAGMLVEGLVQSVTALDAMASLANEGDFAVLARAQAAASATASANATAVGYAVSALHDYGVDFRNSGEFMVLAEASADAASGFAGANAIGFEASGSGLLSGTIENDGDFLVKAEALGGSSALAVATGFSIGSNADGIALTNSAVLSVQAVTDGGTSEATAIKLVDNGSGGPGNVTITNDGGIITARISTDGGDSWSRGTAIDLASASATSVVNLVGAGRITGHIDLASGQVINVSGGETWFDGIINAECMAGACGEGLLNIANGGSLFFRHLGDGPSGAYLEELNIASGGTLILELPTGTDPETNYPRIVTDVANLDGTLLVRSGNGLYGDSYTFDNVIDANVRNGQFDSCGIDGNPVLLELTCSYDGEGNVDLGLERVAFHAVSGLTRNQTAVGSGIEAVYDLDLAGPFAELVGELFTFGDAQYRRALDQLAGASHAAYLQSFNSLGEAQAMLIDRGIGCELPGSPSSLSCRPGKFNLWGQLDYANRQSDGDQEAGGYDADRWTAIIGADVEVGPDVIVGASLAKVGNRLTFHDAGRWNANGYQLGAYGAIDRGDFYARIIGTMAWFDGDSRRTIDWTPLGGTLAGQLGGDPDARLWTLGAHFGYRVTLSGGSLLTPFFNLDHSNARLDGFTEAGLAGADLAIADSTSSRTSVTVGAKWAADLGSVIPQAELGYRYRFGDRRAKVDAAFADEAGSDFEIVSAAEKRGALLAGLSLGGKAGPVDLRVGYQGLFDGNATSHSANLRVILPLGGK